MSDQKNWYDVHEILEWLRHTEHKPEVDAKWMTLHLNKAYHKGREHGSGAADTVYAETKAECEQLKYFFGMRLTCGSCGCRFSVDRLRERCDNAHREHWSHEWQTAREREGWNRVLQLEAELDSLRTQLATSQAESK